MGGGLTKEGSMANDDLRNREREALEFATGLRRQGTSQDDIASKVREKFGDDVDPAVTAMRAVADVNREPLQQPVTPEQGEALKKRMAEDAGKKSRRE